MKGRRKLLWVAPFAVAFLVAAAIACTAEPMVTERIVEVEVTREVTVETIVEHEVVRTVPVEKVVVQRVVETVPIEVVVDREVVKEIPVEKVMVKEVVETVLVEVVVEREVVKEVPVEKVVVQEVVVTAIPTPSLTVSPTPAPSSTPDLSKTQVTTSTRTPTTIPVGSPTPTRTPAPTPARSGSADSDRDVLVALYNATNGANWENSENWLSERPISEWHGVKTNSNGRVTELRLGGNGLRGAIPQEIGDLVHLRELWFGDDNDLMGELPSSLRNLEELQVLDLGWSEISGAIPAWLGELTSLHSAYLDGNRFRGEIPVELGNLIRLQLLTFHDNAALTGVLPEELTSLNRLGWLTFEGTDICVPSDDMYQNWLRTIEDWSGEVCPSELTNSDAGDQGVIVRDIFGRVVNETGITLVDWEGHIANPALRYFVELPGASAILRSTEPRLFFDLPSTIGANGPSKFLTRKVGEDVVEFRLSIFPDRDRIDETHSLTIQYANGDGKVRSKSIDVNVIDQDLDRPLDFNIISDFSHDQTGFFDDPVVRATTQQAADDYAYFIADMDLDEVPIGGEDRMWINESGNPDRPAVWGRGDHLTNTFAYTGYLMNVYGYYYAENGPGGSGGPSCEGRNQSSDGREYLVKRSGSILMNPRGNYGSIDWIKSPDESGWWEAESGNNVKADFYSIALHEIGHSFVFSSCHDGFAPYRIALAVDDTSVTEYYGSNPVMNDGDHFFDTIDPVSGQGAFGNEYGGEVPNGRWLVTKFDLLIAQAMGYKLRDTSPFRDLSISAEPVTKGTAWDAYTHTFEAVGGIPAYYWTVDSGDLPEGVSFDSFTGTLWGAPTETGKFNFTIRLRDQTDGHAGVTRSVTLEIVK